MVVPSDLLNTCDTPWAVGVSDIDPRVMATGMSVRVQHGVLQTTEDGVAKDTLWVTDFKGRKVGQARGWAVGVDLSRGLRIGAPPFQLAVRGTRLPGALSLLASKRQG